MIKKIAVKSKPKTSGEIRTRDFDEYVKLKENGYILLAIVTGKTNQDKTYVMKK